MTRKTLLHAEHLAAGARMVDFGGWDMPLHYGSQIDEHNQVRRDAGMFDVSHMTVVDIEGEETRAFLRYLLANNVDKLKAPGKALYSCMLNERGGVIDDLITYAMDERHFRMVVNAATREKDLAWLRRQADAFEVSVGERDDLGMIAVQGPRAREHFAATLGEDKAAAALALGRFSAAFVDDLFVARTGYTGEDGFELVIPAERTVDLWRKLVAAGVAPCGLGARDTLRLEAGMNLYGQDMDEDCLPYEAALGWTVALEPEDRDFVGRAALESARKVGIERKLVGLVLEGRGVLRPAQKVLTAAGEGHVTSGSYAPTLGASIAMARVPAAADGEAQVEIRSKRIAARIVRPPFVRDGRPCEGL